VAMPLPSLLFPSFQSDELKTGVCHLPSFTTKYRALLVDDLLCVWLPDLRRLSNAKRPKMTNENDRILKKKGSHGLHRERYRDMWENGGKAPEILNLDTGCTFVLERRKYQFKRLTTR